MQVLQHVGWPARRSDIVRHAQTVVIDLHQEMDIVIDDVRRAVADYTTALIPGYERSHYCH